MNLLQIHEPGQTPLPHDEEVAVGIDLGTTHSVVAFSDNSKVEVLRDVCGGALIPSVVHYGKNGGVEVGKEAASRIGERGIVSSIKRLMGRSIEDVNPADSAYEFDKDASQKIIRLNVAERKLTPIDISADMLRHIKAVAERSLGNDIHRAVITVPAYFDDAARQATRDAAQLAGLEVLRLINEPTAAALAYGLDNEAEGVYAIYDFGGGTFDISLLRMEKGVFQVLSTAGDIALGGDDIDQKIAESLCTEFGDEVAPSQRAILLSHAKSVKEQLSESDETELEITLNNKTIKRTFSRAWLEEQMEEIASRTIAICHQVLDDSDMAPGQVNGVVLVGGSTRIPLIRRKVEEYFAQPPLAEVDPDEVVAMGAALQAERLTRGSDSLLLDVVPLSLGLGTMGELTEKIIHRNTPIPVSVSQEFTTWQDGQTAMVIHVVQGEREMVEQNRSLAKFELHDIPPMAAGLARIKVTFAVDADGLLSVNAEETISGKQQNIAVKPAYGLETEEMERMLRESMEHAKEDITERLLTESRMEAKRIIIELESAIKESGDIVEADEMQMFAEQRSKLQEAINGNDRDAIDYEAEQLGHISKPFAERRMDKAIAGALKGAHVDEVG